MAQTPVIGRVYTLAEIYRLSLRDSPSLGFSYLGKPGVIQDSHVTREDMLARCPQLAETRWRYLRETYEWIPVFEYASEDDSLLACLDLEPSLHGFTGEDEGVWWATPKGSPRQQYFYPQDGKPRPFTKDEIEALSRPA